MLIRHIAFYLAARGLPGIVNFLALAIYTRLLSSEQFGRYSIVIASMGLVQIAVFQWLQLVCGRFVPAHADDPETVLRPVSALFLMLSVASVAGAAVALIWTPPGWRQLVAIATVLLIVSAWHELNLAYASAQLAPGRYGAMSAVNSVLAIALGALLAWLGWGAKAPLLGLVAGAAAAWFLVARAYWVGGRPKMPDADQMRRFASYGLPLAGVGSLVWVTASSDRLIIAALLGDAQTAFYAVGYDLAQPTLVLLLTIVNTAAMPLAFKLLETDGAYAAREQIRQNGEVIFALACSGSAGLVAIGPAMIDLFIGEEFRQGALTVFPWIAVSAGLVGIKIYYFDIAFHLTKKSKWLLVTTGLAAVINIIMNFALIPGFGIVGAAWGALIAYFVATVSSWAIGRHVFAMPPLLPMFVHGMVPAIPTYFAARLCMQTDWSSTYKIIFSIAAGGLVALTAFMLLNTANIRDILIKRKFLK